MAIASNQILGLGGYKRAGLQIIPIFGCSTGYYLMDKYSLFYKLDKLKSNLNGELEYDETTRIIYSTDASVYKEKPIAVAWPKDANDIIQIVTFAANNNIGLIMRAAGTSLAGQVVGSGLVIDISRHLNRILDINVYEKWVKVQPGVVLDELNIYLRSYGLFFGPETSTSNRCNIGGMVGNNACGSHSIIYGSTRDHVLELKSILSDGSEATFKDLSKTEFYEKCGLPTLEGSIYRNIGSLLGDKNNREIIESGYPDPSINRRNTGYALDLLIDNEVFNKNSVKKINLCNLLAGSEGTLAITTEIKLNLVKLPPPSKALVCVHLKDRYQAFKANLITLKYSPTAVEMMDDRILELTKNSLSQRSNRFFIEGEPGALLIVEFAKDSKENVKAIANTMIDDLKNHGYGYAFPIIWEKNISKVWNLRKAGLGVLSNMVGDSKPVSLIEDTAVNVEQLPQYIADFEEILKKFGKEVVYHAHIGSGELHIRPILNLKDKADVEVFRQIGVETAKLVKRYRGSMSGEHGDGRLRGEFIPIILGEHNYMLIKEVKRAWDPGNILNPQKIVDTPAMNSSLRYEPGKETMDIPTIFDFSSTTGIVRAAEKCNGSGDCRKSSLIGGTMCPVYMATGNERDSTRARANVFREFISSDPNNVWDHKEIYEILDLCISCKGCKSECPSGVDISKLKAEFSQHWYDIHGIPPRAFLIAHITTINKIGSICPSFFNAFLKNRLFSSILKKSIGFAQQRPFPELYDFTLKKWIRRNKNAGSPVNPISKVCLFIDEFTNLNDTGIGICAIKLLNTLGYEVITVDNFSSARTFLSKGLVRKAKKLAKKNILLLSGIIGDNIPLLGIEPSAILAFRDEYPELMEGILKQKAISLSKNALLIDEFIASEFKKGRISDQSFSTNKQEILLHAHCQQKAVSSSTPTIEMLSIPTGYKVKEIPSGCCGMAGSFGYEKEHYHISQKIGELVLFPAVREANPYTIIAASGTSCRQQIKDGTGKIALHPIEILFNALAK